MNVLKLLRCFWKQPVAGFGQRAVNYYVLYERVNHIVNANYRNEAEFRFLVNHEDEIDRLIYRELQTSLEQINGIEQLVIYNHEFLLYGDTNIDTRSLALNSNIAVGRDYRPLILSTNTQVVTNLATRVWFSDVADEGARAFIDASIPRGINIGGDGEIPSLIGRPFMPRNEAALILKEDQNA